MKTTNRVKASKVPKTVKSARAGSDLEKGQLYLMQDTHVEIVEVGKLLAHYRLIPRLGQRGIPMKLGSRADVAAFLNKNEAKLVKR